MRSRQPGFRPDRRTGALCLYYFLIKSAVNVSFIASQTTFLKRAGFASLPWVYAVMNVIYIIVQLGWISRLNRTAGGQLVSLNQAFLAAGCIQAIAISESLGSAGAGVAFACLLTIMILDLLFNQFFVHYINEIFPLTEGKQVLPVITGVGSLSFIVSGLGLRIGLGFVSFPTMLCVNAGLLGACTILFAWLVPRFPEREPHQSIIRRTTPDAPTEEHLDEHRDEHQKSSPMQSPLILASFLTMISKYWLDYQYSRSITLSQSSEADLASFIAVFTSATDLLVLVTQLFISGRVMQSIRLGVLLRFLPLLMTACSLVTSFFPGVISVLTTQFLFTYVIKTFHNPALSLMYNPLPTRVRQRVLSRAGTAASVGCMMASLTLILFQNSIGTGLSFALLALVFAGLDRGIVALSASYEAEIRQTLLEDGTDACDLTETQLVPDDVDRIILPLLDSVHSTRQCTQMLVTLLRSGSPVGQQRVIDRLRSDSLDDRTRASVLEVIGSDERLPVVESLLRIDLGSRDPRVRSAAATALVQRATGQKVVADALRELERLIDDPDHPEFRAAGAAALGRIGHDCFLTDLVHLLDDISPRVRKIALSSVERIGTSHAIGLLDEHLSTNPESDQIRVIRDRMHRRYVGSLASQLDEIPARDRDRIASHLGRIGDPSRRALVEAAIRCRERDARAALVQWIEETHDPESLNLAGDMTANGGMSLRPALDHLASGVHLARGPILHLLRCLDVNRMGPSHHRLLAGLLGRLQRDGERIQSPADMRDGRNLSDGPGSNTSLSAVLPKESSSAETPPRAIPSTRDSWELLLDEVARHGQDTRTCRISLHQLVHGEIFARSLAREYLESQIKPDLIAGIEALAPDLRPPESGLERGARQASVCHSGTV